MGGDTTVLGNPTRYQALYLVSIPGGLITTFIIKSGGKFQIEGTISPVLERSEIEFIKVE